MAKSLCIVGCFINILMLYFMLSNKLLLSLIFTENDVLTVNGIISNSIVIGSLFVLFIGINFLCLKLLKTIVQNKINQHRNWL